MTVLGSGNEKNDDKEQLVGKDDVATIMPNRIRLVKLQRRRSVITLILSIGFLFIFLCGIFFTVCFIKKIGPFRRHFVGQCRVGSTRLNGHKKAFESYEITDKYAMIHVPMFHSNHGSFDSVRTLHVFDKKVTVIQYHDKCFVKPMMKHQMLRNDWFEKLRILSHHHFRTPKRFTTHHLRVLRPALPVNYLRDEIHHLADAICNSRPVFRLMFQIHPHQHPWSPRCHTKCYNCDVNDQVHIWKLIGGRQCRKCHCKKGTSTGPSSPMKSSNKVDPNCKTIRCENKCANTNLVGCVQCRCIDGEHGHMAINKVRLPPVINQIKLSPMIVNEENKQSDTTGTILVKDMPPFGPIYRGGNRHKRSIDSKCAIVAKIFEGYIPLGYNMNVPLDYIHDC